MGISQLTTKWVAKIPCLLLLSFVGPSIGKGRHSGRRKPKGAQREVIFRISYYLFGDHFFSEGNIALLRRVPILFVQYFRDLTLGDKNIRQALKASR